MSTQKPLIGTPEVREDAVSLRRSVAAGAVGVFVHWFDWAVGETAGSTLLRKDDLGGRADALEPVGDRGASAT